MTSTTTTGKSARPTARKYQVMPPLSAEEYAALRADIAERGVLVPVVRDQHGNLLDGHHRVQVAEELGIDYRVDVVQVHDDGQARTLARTYNLSRRHLSRAQKRQLIADEITANPDRSDRDIGRLFGCDHKTVGSVRRELSGEFPQPDEHREFHPLTEFIPLMAGITDSDIDALAESIKKIGLIDPITLHPDGSIIDGRLRYLACVRAKVRPEYKTVPAAYTELHILGLIRSKNLVRQHLNPSQRAMLVAKYEQFYATAMKNDRTTATTRARSPEGK
jgi:ParB-like chromosome segregation protein Spo0J